MVSLPPLVNEVAAVAGAMISGSQERESAIERFRTGARSSQIAPGIRGSMVTVDVQRGHAGITGALPAPRERA